VGSFPLLRVRGETRSTCPGRVTAREERDLRLALWHRTLVGVVRRFLYLIRGTNDRLEFFALSRGVCSKIKSFYRFLTKSSYQTNLSIIEMASALMPVVTPSTPAVRPGCLAPGSPCPRWRIYHPLRHLPRVLDQAPHGGAMVERWMRSQLGERYVLCPSDRSTGPLPLLIASGPGFNGSICPAIIT
jgi:hypothetical protein